MSLRLIYFSNADIAPYYEKVMSSQNAISILYAEITLSSNVQKGFFCISDKSLQRARLHS